jgi:GNAT superfamily N-acetyltransferase
LSNIDRVRLSGVARTVDGELPNGSHYALPDLRGKGHGSKLGERLHESTVAEIAQEKAASLGRAGRRMEDALRALARLDERTGGEDRAEALLDDAAEALYYFIVQREACGLRDTEELLREMNVPRAVRMRMGVRKKG